MDPLCYAPLLTSAGLSVAYDPTVSVAPPPPPGWVPTPQAYKRACNTHVDYVSGSYNPTDTTPRPESPLYSAHSPPPEDVHISAVDEGESGDDIEEECLPEIKDLKIFARSPEEILKLSAVHVSTDKIAEHGSPLIGGLRDPRFGCSGGRSCGTCGSFGAHRCNGHFGSYSLCQPLFNVAYNKIVILWLRVICNECGHVHASPESVAGFDLRSILKAVPSECEECNSKMYRSLSWKAAAQVVVETSTGEKISAKQALSVFRMVPDDHPVFRVVTHPRRMLTTVLFIPSIVIRPAVGGAEEGESARGESDISYRLVKIIRADLLLKKKERDGVCDYISRQSALLGLQNAYTGYIDSRQCYRKNSRPNNTANGTDSSHQSNYKCLRDLLSGKTGEWKEIFVWKGTANEEPSAVGPVFKGSSHHFYLTDIRLPTSAHTQQGISAII